MRIDSDKIDLLKKEVPPLPTCGEGVIFMNGAGGKNVV